MCRWAYLDSDWARIAALAPLVLSCCEEGDEVARGIVDAGVRELVHSIDTVAKKCSFSDDFNLVLSGAQPASSEIFTTVLIRYIVCLLYVLYCSYYNMSDVFLNEIVSGCAFPQICSPHRCSLVKPDLSGAVSMLLQICCDACCPLSPDQQWKGAWALGLG